MADIRSVNSYVADFRAQLDNSMRGMLSTIRSYNSYWSSDRNEYKNSELDYIDSIISKLILEANSILQREVLIDVEPLKDFTDTAPVSTISNYTPKYKDITTATNSIVSNLLTILNIDPDAATIDTLINTNKYTSSALDSLSKILDSCIDKTSSIGTPTELYNAIVLFELEKLLYELKKDLTKVDSATGAAGFRKPNSKSVYLRASIVNKYNRDRLTKYKEALSTFNQRLATLLTKAFQTHLSTLKQENDFSKQLVSALADISKAQLDMDLQLKETVFVEYTTKAQGDITKLQQELQVTKMVEPAYRDFATTIFNAEMEQLTKVFDAEVKTAQAELELNLRANKYTAQEFVINAQAKLTELAFVQKRLEDYMSTMGELANAKVKYTEQAQLSYQKALKTMTNGAIALSTEKI